MARSDQDPITRAIQDEELALLRALPEEPPYLEQALQLFSGRTAWVNVGMLLAQLALFVAGGLFAWRFYQATDAVEAVKLGITAAVMVLMSLIIKMSFVPVMRLDLVRRDLKRLTVLMGQKAK